jgi:hypothetical protein
MQEAGGGAASACALVSYASCLVRDRLAHGHISGKRGMYKSDTVLAGFTTAAADLCACTDF